MAPEQRRPKRLFVVHGRSTKPGPEHKRELVRAALIHGLERVDAGAARLLETGAVQFSLVYYGDVTNRLLVSARPELRQGMIEAGGDYFDPPEATAAALDRLLARPTEEHDSAHYARLVAEFPNRRGFDRVASLLGPLAAVCRLTLFFARRFFPDLSGYFSSRKLASEIRTRLQRPLREALRRGEDIALVSHSLGSVVAYDVLWKLSHMSEYDDVHGAKVRLWLTLGSPLGDPSVPRALYDSNESDDGLYPTNVVDWVNTGAYHDYVCRERVAHRYRRMLEWGRVRRIRDCRPIYNFWVGASGSNPHKLYGYLNHPEVAAEIARWIRSAPEPTA